jgi:hypothetical protein
MPEGLFDIALHFFSGCKKCMNCAERISTQNIVSEMISTDSSFKSKTKDALAALQRQFNRALN